MSPEEHDKICDEEQVKLGKAAKKIMKELKLDSVLLLATRFDETMDTTVCYNSFMGNAYASRAAAARFVNTEEQKDLDSLD